MITINTDTIARALRLAGACAGRHDPAAAVRAANGWPACAAGCGWPLDPAAAAGGHDRHPGCDDLAPVIPLHNRQRPRQRTA